MIYDEDRIQNLRHYPGMFPQTLAIFMNAPNPKDIPIAQRLALIRQSEQILKRQPKNVTARYNLAMLLKANGQIGEALRTFAKGKKTCT